MKMGRKNKEKARKPGGSTQEASQDGHHKSQTDAFKYATFDRPKSLLNKKLVTLIRNGERIDRVFPEWLNLNFTDAGEYLPTDLNHPIEMLQRAGGIGDYVDDSPITEIGGLTSQIIGRSFRLHDIWPLQKIYCSPSLRCIQSAAAFIKGTNKSVKICIEPGLFDWTKWYKSIPRFLTAEELVKVGYPINVEYTPFMKAEELEATLGQETIDEFYSRIRACLSTLTSTSDSDRIAIITHATSIDAAVKALRKCPPRVITQSDMYQMGIYYPYSTVVAMAQERKCTEWSFVHQPIAPLSFLGVSNKADVKFINSTTRAKPHLNYDV